MKNFWSKVALGVIGLVTIFAISAIAKAAPLNGNPNVTISDNRAGETTTHLVSLRTSTIGAIPTDGYIDVEYTAGFDVTGATLGSFSGNLGGAWFEAIGSDTARIHLGTSSVGGDTDVWFQLSGIINHQTTGVYNVIVSTYDNIGALIDGPTSSYGFSIRPRAPNSILLTPVGDQNVSADIHEITYYAVVTDMYGNNVDDGTVVGWIVDNPDFSVSSSTTTTINGQASVVVTTSIVAGQSSVLSAQSGVSFSSGTITVTHGIMTGMYITPYDAHVATADDTLSYNAYAHDQFDNVWDITGLVTFSTNDPEGGFTGNVYEAGLVGWHQITGSYNGFSDITGVTVDEHGNPIAVEMLPNNSNITADQGVAYTVNAYDSDNNSWDATFDYGTSYTTTDPYQNNFTGNYFDGHTVGAWTNTATYQGLSDSSTANVTHGNLVDIVINPFSASLTADESQQFTAYGIDNDGNLWDITGISNWYTTDPAGSFSAPGLYNAGRVDIWQVCAEYNGFTNCVYVDVYTHGVITGLNINPAGPVNMTADDYQDFYAEAYDADGNTWNITNLVNWHENDPWGNFAGNNYYAGQVGSWTIYASYGGYNSNNVTANVSHGNVVAVNMNPNLVNLTADDSQQFTLTAYDSDGNAWDATNSAIWTTTDPLGNIVNGLYDAGLVGSWQVDATYNGYSDYADVNVSHGVASIIVINPLGPINMTADDSQTFTAMAYDANGNNWDVTGLVTWHENDPLGNFTANTYNAGLVGSWTIYATLEGLTSNNVIANVSHGVEVSMHITPLGPLNMTADDTQLFEAILTDADGNSWNVTASAVWYENDPAGYFFGNLYNAGTVGSWQIYAGYNALFSNIVTVNVTHGQAVSLDVIPNSLVLSADDDYQFTAIAADSDGNSWDVTNFYFWDTNDPWGKISNGLYCAGQTGTWTVTASYNGLVDNSTVTVYPGAIHHIVIDPSTDFIVLAGNIVHFTAVAYDQDGNIVPAFTFSWNNAVDGWFDEISQGNYDVYAYIGSIKSNIVKVTVYPAGINHIIITPEGNQTITSGQTIQFYATAYDQFNNKIWGMGFDWFNTNSLGLFSNGLAGEYIVKACNESVCSNEVLVAVKTETNPTNNSKVSSESEQTTSTNEKADSSKTSTKETSETEVIVDDQGIIKGTEVTTIGPELDDENGKTSWITIIMIAIGIFILLAAYYSYNYFLSSGPYTEKKDDSDKFTTSYREKNDSKEKIDEEEKNRW